MERDSSLKDGNTSSSSLSETKDHKISITQIYTFLLSNMEVDIEARKNFTDKLLNILTLMTPHDSRKVHHAAFVCQTITVQDHMWCFPLRSLIIHAHPTCFCFVLLSHTVSWWWKCSPKLQLFPKTVQFSLFFSFLRDSLYLDESTNGRELLSVESFGYICEDQTTGPLHGPLGGCESLQRRWAAGQMGDKTVSDIKIKWGLQPWIVRNSDDS